jgi:hypothetical protein
MVTKEWMEAHENKVENGWLLLQLQQFPGIGLMGCPKCGNIQLNPNAMENIKIINEFQEAEKNRRISVASGLVDPAGRVIGLKG